jgi:hypothetical protein
VSANPIGQNGGMNVFRYAGSNPIRHVDPTGLFRFEKRPLGGGTAPWVPGIPSNPIDDYTNTEASHEHGFYDFVSPQSIPLIVLEHAGVAPEASLEGRLLAALDCTFEGVPDDYLCDYEALYRQSSEGIHPLDLDTLEESLARQHQAKKTLLLDLYFGQQYSYNAVSEP